MLDELTAKLKRFKKWATNIKKVEKSKKSLIIQNKDLIKNLIDDGYSKKHIFEFLQKEGLNCSYDFFRVCINEILFDKKKIVKRNRATNNLYNEEYQRELEILKEFYTKNPNAPLIDLIKLNRKFNYQDTFNSAYVYGHKIPKFR